MTSTLPGRGLWGAPRLVFPRLRSTQDQAMHHASSADDGTLVLASHQTHGRGRFHRSWLAPAGDALTFSILLHDPPDAGPLIGRAAAVAVADLLTSLGLPALLKWPNDVLVHHRKIAGILIESAPERQRLVLGIGVNVNVSLDDMAPLCPDRPATSMLVETGPPPHSIPAVLDQLIPRLEQRLAAARSGDPSDTLAFWTAHDALAGRRLTVEAASGEVTGLYDGVEPDGRLRIRLDDGAIALFWSGDVHAWHPIGKAHPFGAAGRSSALIR